MSRFSSKKPMKGPQSQSGAAGATTEKFMPMAKKDDSPMKKMVKKGLS